ncbi:rab-like protein 3 isoform X2 [Teleopsis dalmanni]|uniref:rab-like protein 3 isoform X2 n=1 Tax=Teleopsis dalmanni TaxID=139649 RepID=UPI0018CE23CB|nr:rab-like protein 3 isoform X2 [Teleopsis dalmanni]
MANNIDKVKIIVVGDSGVGKTCLTHLIAHNEPLIRPGWTVGCNIEVKLHEYKEGTPQQQTYFIELFDIGGSLSHKNTRGVFYTPTHGIILVHDLTNRKSHENLRDWLYEILNKEGKDTHKPSNIMNTLHADQNVFDREQFLGATQIPILVIGTKLDLIDDKRQPKPLQKTGGIADHCGAEEIWLNCRDTRKLAAGTTDAVKLARFFDRVIEKKTHTREHGYLTDRRKYATTSSYIAPETSLIVNAPNFDFKTNIIKPTDNVLIDSSNLQ